MGTTKATKAADKSQVCRKLVYALHKLYGKSVPKIELPVVETMLFAACLEDNPWSTAEVGMKHLIASFFDLNEIRVSSVNELELVLSPLNKADWKGLRIRSILRHIFETTYSYDFEKLRRQTLEQAVKTLKKVPDVTPFIRDFVLHEILGSHVVFLDEYMLTAAKWLGLVPENSDVNEASEYLKGGLKKSEVTEFCHLLRCLATDPKFVPRFTDHADSEQSMENVMERFAELQLPPKKKPAKPPAPKEVAKPAKTEPVSKVSVPTKAAVSGKTVVPAKSPLPAKAAAPVKSALPVKTSVATSSKPASAANKPTTAKGHVAPAKGASTSKTLPKPAKPSTGSKASAPAKSALKSAPKPQTSSAKGKTKPSASAKPASGDKRTASKPNKKK